MIYHCIDKKQEIGLRNVNCSAFGKPGNDFLLLKTDFVVPDWRVILIAFSF